VSDSQVDPAIEAMGIRPLRQAEEAYGGRLVRASIAFAKRLSRTSELVVTHGVIAFENRPGHEYHRAQVSIVVDGQCRAGVSLRAEHCAELAAALIEVGRVAALESRERERNASAW